MIERAGAELLCLSAYGPGLNPVENTFARLKAPLREAAERTIAGLRSAIIRIIDLVDPGECANDSAAAGHDAT